MLWNANLAVRSRCCGEGFTCYHGNTDHLKLSLDGCKGLHCILIVSLVNSSLESDVS